MSYYLPVPLDSGSIASAQGPNANRGNGNSHFPDSIFRWGWDFSVQGEAVKSIASGIVISWRDDLPSVGSNSDDHGLGNFITIAYEGDHGAILYATYAHLAQGSVSSSGIGLGPLFEVDAGQTIGTSAASGMGTKSDGSYAYHLHVHFGTALAEWTYGTYADGRNDPTSPVSFGQMASDWVGGQDYLSPATFGSSSGADHIGTSAGETFFGSPHSDYIHAGGGEDYIHQGTGNDSIDGGDGTDTVIYNFSGPNYDIRVVGSTILVEGPEGTDRLRNVEWISFRDAGGPPYQSVDVTALDGYGDLFVTDPASVGNTYDDAMGNVWFTTANLTAAIQTTTSDWGITKLIQTAGSLWDELTSEWSWSREQGPDGAEAIVARRGTDLVAFAEPIQPLEFEGIGSISLPSLLEPKAQDDHPDTSGGAVTVGSGTITSFTSAQGSIESRNDVDVFEAQLQGGQEYSFLLWANTTQNSRLDPELTIRAPNGTVWRNDNLTNNTTMSVLSFVAPQSGTYVFEARGMGDSTGSYWLNITPIDIDPTADELEENDNPRDDDTDSYPWHWQGTPDDDRPSSLTLGQGSAPSVDADNFYRGHDGDDRIEAGRGDDVVWGDDDEDRLSGEDGDDTIRGGRGDDTIAGGDDDDLIYGESGDDRIDGDTWSSSDSGNDTIYGGDGEDRIRGLAGDDYIKGEDDNDDIGGYGGNDELYGDRGDDEVDGGDGDDLLFGGLGNDTLDGGNGRDRLAGEDGDDSLEGDDGDDALYGGEDDDTLQGGEGDDLLHGEDGTDTADFSDGRDGVIVNLFDEIAVSNDLGTDRLYGIENVIGSRGDDVIDGDHSRNVLRGDDDADIIRGHNGNDTIFGDDDDDVVWGDEGEDYVYGGDDEDDVRGGLGNDHLFGDAGDDHLRGEQGDDEIDGGTGTDTVFFWGEHDDFSIGVGGAGEVIVTDLRPDGLEGRDVLTDVEYLEFFDGKALVSDLLAAAPFAADDIAEVNGDQPASLALLENDTTNASGAHYTNAQVVDGRGSASIIGGQLIYDPGDSFSDLLEGDTESVTIEYSFATSGFQAATGTAEVTVNGTAVPNVPPTASPIDAGSVAEDGSVVTIDLLVEAAASDSDGGSLGVANVSVTDQNGATVVFDLTDAALAIDPTQFAAALATGASATLTVAYDVTDGQGGATPNTGQLVVDGLDGPITWYRDGDGDGFGVDDPTTNQSAYAAPTGTSAVASDSDDSDAAVFPGAPEINDGKDNDQDGAIDEDNTAPLADAESFEVNTGGTLTLAAAMLLDGDTDAEGDALAVASVSSPVNGTVSLDDKSDADASNDEVIFAPAASFSGQASFDYTVTDGFGGESTVTVGVTVINREGGSSDNDSLIGTSGPNEISGHPSDDTIAAGAGDDTIDGGDGDDQINTGIGFDLVEAGGGNDLVQGLNGFDTLNGGTGNDTLQGNFGNDELNGGDGDDELQGGVGFDLMRGDAGNDLLVGRDGFDTLEGGTGNDTLQGNAGNDVMSGGADDDLLIGGIGSDVMNGDAGNDLLQGQGGFDTLEGGDGADTLQGNNSDDVLNGGAGDDLLEGGLANDVLNGDAGNDTLEGANGFDVLNGGDGDDRLEGNAGNDTLDGGAGNDVLRGGLGADTFVFRAGSGNDRVVEKGIVDSIELEAALLGGGSPDAEDLRDISTLDADGFLLLDFGNGDTLTFTGITNTNAILDDVSFI